MSVPAYEYDIFISCGTSDRPWVEGFLKQALGLSADRVLTSGDFALGASLVSEIERAVMTSRYTLLVLSPDFLANEWTGFGEQLISHVSVTDRQSRIIPLMLESCDLPLRIDFKVRLDCRDKSEWEFAASRLRDLLGQPEPVCERLKCPYPGMRAFQLGDKHPFFGRENETRELIEQLRFHSFVAIIGSSGSGKSSLAFAGLVPAIRESTKFGDGSWVCATLRPGEMPLLSLEALLGTELKSPKDAVGRFLNATRRSGQPDANKLLLIVDQFEEIFTVGRDHVDEFQKVLPLLAAVPECFVVLTIRADFYGDLMEKSPIWSDIKAHRYELTRIDSESLRQAIVQPAQSVGVEIDPALVERLLADAGTEPGILPFLQETLVDLWERLERRYLPMSAYEILSPGEKDAPRNCLDAAMSRRADFTLDALQESQKQVIARRILLRLVQFGEGRSNTRRQQTVADLRAFGDDPKVFNTTLAHLTDSRLLTATGATGAATDGMLIDISHESLLTGWPLLKDWISQRRDAETVRRRLEAKAKEWARLGRKFGGLLDAAELHEADAWLVGFDSSELGYSSDLQTLVAASRWSVRLQRAALAAIPTLIICVLAIVTWSIKTSAIRDAKFAHERIKSAEQIAAAKGKTAETERQRANEADKFAKEQQRLNTLAATRLIGFLEGRAEKAVEENDFISALPWFVETLRIAEENPDLDEEAYRIRLAEMWRQSPVLQHIWFQEASVVNRQIAPQADTIATVERTSSPDGSWEGRLRVWDVESGEILAETAANASITHLQYSPDGTLMLTVDSANTFQLRATRTLKSIAPPFSIPADQIWSVSLKPVSKLLMVVGTNSNDKLFAHVWNWKSGSPVTTPILRYRHIEVSDPDELEPKMDDAGTRLIVQTSKDTIEIWNLEQSNRITALNLGGFPSRAVFSRDGRTLAIGGWEVDPVRDERRGVVWLINPATGELKRRLSEHSSEVEIIVFSPDGRQMITACDYDKVLLWDLNDLETPIDEIPAEESSSAMEEIAFDPSGRRIATQIYSNLIRIWDVNGLKPLTGRISHDTQDPIEFSPDGQRLLLKDWNLGVVTVWNLESDRAETPPLRHIGTLSGVRFCRDGYHFLSWTDHAVYRWALPVSRFDVQTIEQRDAIVAADLSHDGTRIVAAIGKWPHDKYREMRIWNIDEGTSATEPLRHDLPINHVMFSMDSRFVLSGSGVMSFGRSEGPGEARVWDSATGQALFPPIAHENAVSTAVFSPDGTHFATAAGSVARVWHAHSGEPTTGWLEHAFPVCHLTFSVDSKWLITSSGSEGSFSPAGGDARIWNLETGTPIGKPFLHPEPVRLSALLPDKSRLITASGEFDTTHSVTGGNGVIRIIDVASGDILSTVRPAGRLVQVSFDPGLKRAVLVGNFDRIGVSRTNEFNHDEVRIIDIQSGETMTAFAAGLTDSAQLSTDGRYLATAGSYGFRLWDTTTGGAITPSLGSNSCDRVWVSPDRRQLIASAYQSLHVKNLSLDSRSITDWQRTARTQSAKTFISQTLQGEVDEEQFRHDYLELKRSAAKFYEVSPRDVILWHQHEIRVGHAFSKVWHANLLLSMTPDAPDLLRTRAMAFAAQEQWQAAIEDYNRLITITSQQNPELPTLFAQRANWLAKNGDWEAAAKDYTTSLEADQDNGEIWFERARMYGLLDQWASAASDLTKALEKSSGSGGGLQFHNLELLRNATYLRGVAWAAQGDWDRAYNDLSERLGNDNPQLHYYHALGALDQKEHGLYRDVCSKVVEELGNSVNADTGNLAAWVCALAPNGLDDYSIPLRLARVAVDNSPEKPNCYNTLGAIEFRAGNLDAAIESFRKSDSMKGTTTDWIFLAMAHFNRGETEEANSWLQKAEESIDRETRTEMQRLDYLGRLEIQMLMREARDLLGSTRPETPLQ